MHRNVVSVSKTQNSSSKKVLEVLVQRLILQDWSLHSWNLWSPCIHWSIVNTKESIAVCAHNLQSYTQAEHWGGWVFLHKHIFSYKMDSVLCLCRIKCQKFNRILTSNKKGDEICLPLKVSFKFFVTISRYTILWSFVYHL